MKVFRLLFGIKRQTMKPRCFVVRNVLPEKVLMLLQAFLAFRFTFVVGNNFFCGNTRQKGDHTIPYPYHTHKTTGRLFVYHFTGQSPEWMDIKLQFFQTIILDQRVRLSKSGCEPHKDEQVKTRKVFKQTFVADLFSDKKPY